MTKVMTPMERVLTSLGHKEADRVPFFLALTMHGAKELGTSIKDYFSKPENVAEGQLRLQKKYQNDGYYPFYYAGVEIEAWGGEVSYSEDGPPNTFGTIIKDRGDIDRIEVPQIDKAKRLCDVLETTRILKKNAGSDIPIFSVVMSPFSIPVMQMGFDKYLDLIYNDKDGFNKLMDKNIKFCVNWANAQLDAGATAIVYFDPVSSLTIIPKELYLKSGYEVAKKSVSQIKGPSVCHFASGRSFDLLESIQQLGFAVTTVGFEEDLERSKEFCKNRISLLGGINAIEMRRWTVQMAEDEVKNVIRKAAKGGGFILSDLHGEIPWQVKDDVILSFSEAVRKWGRYPIGII